MTRASKQAKSRKKRALQQPPTNPPWIQHRLLVIQDIYSKMQNTLETFEGHAGMQLAYLFGEISVNGSIDIWQDLPEDVELLQTFRSVFPPNHRIWDFIVLQ